MCANSQALYTRALIRYNILCYPASFYAGAPYILFRHSSSLYSEGRADYNKIVYTVYAIYNRAASKIYIGQTEDVARRLRQHNDHAFVGYTARFPGEWELIYSESVATRSEALKREKQLKSGNGRAYIKTYIPA